MIPLLVTNLILSYSVFELFYNPHPYFTLYDIGVEVQVM